MQLSVITSPGRPVGPARQKVDAARRVRDLLRAQILWRDFPETQLPSETDLMREFQVGRNVVRAALAELQRQGLVARIQGAGTFVVVRKTRHGLRNGGVGSSIADPMAQLETRVRSHRRGLVGVMAATRLGIPEGHGCLVVESVTTIDRQPVIVATSYVPDPVRQEALLEIIEGGPWRGDWYDVLVRAGMEIEERELVTEAVAADELVASDLAVEVGAPLMFVERRLFLADGTPCEYGFSHCRGDRFAFAYRVSSSERGAR